MELDPRRHRELYRSLWMMLALMALAAAIAMVSADRPPAALDPDGAGGRGYTISLVLFVLPVVALVIWFARHRAQIDRHWEAFWITFGAIVGCWSALDIMLARTFLGTDGCGRRVAGAVVGMRGEQH